MTSKAFVYSSIFIVALLSAYGIKLEDVVNNNTELLKIEDVYSPSNTFETGKELALVYITSHNCGYCMFPNLPFYVEKSKVKAKSIALDAGVNFTVIGVVIGWSVQDGLDHLRNFGEFDEVMAGRSWFNIGARKYIHNVVPSNRKGAVPQIVLVLRDVIAEVGAERNFYEVHNQIEVARFYGNEEIEDFALGKVQISL